MHRLRVLGHHVCGAAQATTTTTATTASHLHLSAAELDAAGQLLGLVAPSPGRAGIALEQHLLVEDDAPAVGRPEHAEDQEWFEPLSRGVVIRKTLLLDQPGGRTATLLFLGERPAWTHAALPTAEAEMCCAQARRRR